MGAVAVVLVVGSYFGGHMSLDRRYDDTTRSSSGKAWKWAQDLGPTRVGTSATCSRTRTSARGSPTTCATWASLRRRRLAQCAHLPGIAPRLADGDYEYLVTAVDFGHSNADQITNVGAWVSSVPGTEVVFQTDNDTVYRLGRPMDPDACP